MIVYCFPSLPQKKDAGNVIYAACTRSLTSPKTHRRERMSSREFEIDFGWVSTTRMSTHVVEVELAILLGCELTIPYRHIMFVVCKQTMRRMRGKVKSPTHQKSMPCQTEFAVSSSILHKPEKWALNTHPNKQEGNLEKFHAQSAKLKEETSFLFFYFVCLLPTSSRACNRFFFSFALQFQWLRHIHAMPYALARRAIWLSTLSTTTRPTHTRARSIKFHHRRRRSLLGLVVELCRNIIKQETCNMLLFCAAF